MNPKDAIGQRKPPLHLIPPVANILESMAMKRGAELYQPFNWRWEQVHASVYYAACMRHLAAWWDGEDVDESGALHLAHARACLGILLDASITGNIINDRPMPGVAAQLIRNLSVDNQSGKPENAG